MKQTNRFPEPSGKNGWYETSRYKNHKFNDVSEIQSSYDYIVVGAGFGGVNAAFRLAENQPGASIALLMQCLLAISHPAEMQASSLMCLIQS